MNPWAKTEEDPDQDPKLIQRILELEDKTDTKEIVSVIDSLVGFSDKQLAMIITTFK